MSPSPCSFRVSSSNPAPERLAEIAIDCLVTAAAGDHTDWNERERIARDHWASSSGQPADVYLGGDLLRPYVSIVDRAVSCLAWSHAPSLPPPPLVRFANEGGQSASAARVAIVGDSRYESLVSDGEAFGASAGLPTVAIASLTNTRRYGAIRFPLNIARLGQWLRFTHAARVHIFDASLDFGGDLPSLGRSIAKINPDLVGLSVNFGELERLEELSATLCQNAIPPILVVGNVLAAWAPDEIQAACAGLETVLVPSYGELPLEAICKSLPGWDALRSEVSLRTGPPSQLVHPDERLLVATLEAGGQLALETSFGCHYGACTFCPRDHRGQGWEQARESEVNAVIASLGRAAEHRRPQTDAVLSLVDEEAFGTSGRGEDSEAQVIGFVETAARHGLSSEIYTRLEQIFDRRESPDWNVRRLDALRALRAHLIRIFVGVESGSNSQLKRYGKGQDVQRIVDALRTGSLAGLPFEFGFITFDPLVTDDELIDNIEFLARRDVVLPERADLASDAIVSLVAESGCLDHPGAPVYESVAYMATELELLATSTYLTLLRRRAPALIGEFDPSFGRLAYEYDDPRIGEVAAHCRVWTEGTFRSVYRVRLASRSLSGHAPFRDVVRRHRAATYSLLVSLTAHFLDEDERVAHARATLAEQDVPLLTSPDALASYRDLWEWVTEPAGDAQRDLEASFDPSVLTHSRAA